MRWEDRIQTVIMLFMGAAAGAVSFTHVHDATVAAGQASWVGWVNAVTIELMAIALGLEIRRRRRAGGAKVRSVMVMMMFFIALSLGAQVLDAEPTPVGWLAASVAALGFLALVKVVLSRPAESAKPAEQPAAPHRPDLSVAPAADREPVDVPSVQAPRPAVTAESSTPAVDWTAAFGTGQDR